MELMRTPRSMELCVTGRCNLRCTYCLHFDSPSDCGKDLPLDDWLRFIDELRRCAVMEVTITGGEPLLRRDLTSLLEGVVKGQMRYRLLTNGILVTDAFAAFLASTGRCASVQVSLDGGRPSVHDVFRGKGSFAKALRGIEALRRHRLKVSVRLTVHQSNVDYLPEAARFLLEELGLDSFSLSSAQFLGRCQTTAASVQLTIEQRSAAMEALAALDQKYPGRIQSSAGPLAEAKHWSQMRTAALAGQSTSPNGGRLTGCRCMFSELAVRPDGVIVPCQQIGHLTLGRINECDLADVWQNSPILRRLRTRDEISLESFAFCKGCPYVGHCTGNCPATAVTLLGTDEHPCPDGCLRRFLNQGGRLPDARLH